MILWFEYNIHDIWIWQYPLVVKYLAEQRTVRSGTEPVHKTASKGQEKERRDRRCSAFAVLHFVIFSLISSSFPIRNLSYFIEIFLELGTFQHRQLILVSYIPWCQWCSPCTMLYSLPSIRLGKITILLLTDLSVCCDAGRTQLIDATEVCFRLKLFNNFINEEHAQ